MKLAFFMVWIYQFQTLYVKCTVLRRRLRVDSAHFLSSQITVYIE